MADKDKRAADDDVEDEDFLWTQEKECLILLLRARHLLQSMIDAKNKQVQDELDSRNKKKAMEKKLKGELSPMDIANILKREPGGDDADLNTELARLKRLVIQEIKHNHVLEGDLNKLDLKISLLIVNKGATHDIAAKRKEAWLARLAANQERKKKKLSENQPKYEMDAKLQEAYGDLFYVLQTEPKYLSKVLYLLQPKEVDEILESTIITLFGEAFSPREEFLLLNLFLATMEQELSVVKNVQDFYSAANDSVLPKLLVSYNKRNQGVVYLRTTLPKVLTIVQDDKNMNLETTVTTVAQEIGKAGLTEDQAKDVPEVQQALDRRFKDIEKVCKAFFDAVFGSIDKLPYGLRWICKVMRELCEKNFKDVNKDEVIRVVGYFVYYRFINVALLNPEGFKIVTGELGLRERKNLIVLSKVLQKAFNLKPFTKAEKALLPLNNFLESIKNDLIKYLNLVPQVQDPEDYLQVDQYLEITQKEKKTIDIKLSEIFRIHALIHSKLDSLAAKDDPLRVVMKDLGTPPESFDDTQDRDITLTLTNRFKQELKEDELNIQIYAETKELMIPILRHIPMGSSVHEMTLPEVLEVGADYAKESKNKILAEQIETVNKNLILLEKAKMVTKTDDYRSFVHDIAIEVANRAAIRERQKKEIARLQATLERLKKNSKFTEEQIADYNKYLQDALKKNYDGKKEKQLQKPQKFSYKKLQEMGVITDSEIPLPNRKGTKFEISAPETGIFEMVIHHKDKNQAPEKIEIQLDELLEKHHNRVDRLEKPLVTLDVDMTLYLVNKHILA